MGISNSRKYEARKEYNSNSEKIFVYTICIFSAFIISSIFYTFYIKFFKRTVILEEEIVNIDAPDLNEKIQNILSLLCAKSAQLRELNSESPCLSEFKQKLDITILYLQSFLKKYKLTDIGEDRQKSFDEFRNISQNWREYLHDLSDEFLQWNISKEIREEVLALSKETINIHQLILSEIKTTDFNGKITAITATTWNDLMVLFELPELQK